MFCRPHYVDHSAVPATIDLGVIVDSRLQVQQFCNRFDDAATVGLDPLQVTLRGATDAQIGALGEETASILLQRLDDATIVAMGDAGRARAVPPTSRPAGHRRWCAGRRRGQDPVHVGSGGTADPGRQPAPSASAARGTRGRAPARQPALSGCAGTGLDRHRQRYAGMDVRAIVVDFVAMLAQQWYLPEIEQGAQAFVTDMLPGVTVHALGPRMTPTSSRSWIHRPASSSPRNPLRKPVVRCPIVLSRVSRTSSTCDG